MNSLQDLIGETIIDIWGNDGDITIVTKKFKINVIDPIYPGESFKFEINNRVKFKGEATKAKLNSGFDIPRTR